MITNKKYYKFIVFLFFAVVVILFGSCQSTSNTTHKPSKYQKVRTRHIMNKPWTVLKHGLS